MTHKKIEKIEKPVYVFSHPSHRSEVEIQVERMRMTLNEIIDALTPEKEEEQAMGSYVQESGLGTVSGGEIYTATSLKEEWKEKSEMIDFLKHILPYWQSDDLDDYMYMVHHYDLERVATKLKEYVSQAVQEERARVREHLERQRDALKGHKYQVSAQDVGEQIIGASILFLDNPTQR